MNKFMCDDVVDARQWKLDQVQVEADASGLVVEPQRSRNALIVIRGI